MRAAVETSLRGSPSMTPSIRIGVWAESQSWVSCGEVWKYQAISPVATSTAISVQVKRLSPGRATPVYPGVGFPVPKM